MRTLPSAVVIAVAAFAKLWVAIAVRNVQNEDVSHTLLSLSQEQQTFNVWSFNLEGRGGNQVDQDGKDRRSKLMTFFDELCGDPDRPDVILTQEDTNETINECYKAVSSCSSEEYWWNDKFQFGDGVLMLNRVYVKKDLTLDRLSVGVVRLTTDEMEADGFNPRCAATATFYRQNATVGLASFHMSGGYVDDRLTVTEIGRSSPTKEYFKHLRQIQITSMVQALKPLATNLIIGGDTNGFPEKQAWPCQEKRITNNKTGILRQWTQRRHAEGVAELTEQDKLTKQAPYKLTPRVKEFLEYLTLPDSVLGLRRLEAKVKFGDSQNFTDGPQDGRKVCKSVLASTTAHGGQPDQFFTNVEGSTSKIIAKGLGEAPEPPFPPRLSDHNIVAFTTTLETVDTINSSTTGASQSSEESKSKAGEP